MKNKLRKIGTFYNNHSHEIAAFSTIAVTIAVTVGAVVALKKLDNSMLVDAQNFIESKGLESEFLDFIVED